MFTGLVETTGAVVALDPTSAGGVRLTARALKTMSKNGAFSTLKEAGLI